MGTYGDPWAPLGAYGGLWAPFCLPLSLLTHFPHFPILVFKVFFTFVLPCLPFVQGGSPIIFQLCPPVLFFSFGGGVDLDLGIVSPNFLWALDP